MFPVSIYVIGATVEQPKWLKRENAEKIGRQKTLNSSYNAAQLRIVLDDLCLHLISSP